MSQVRALNMRYLPAMFAATLALFALSVQAGHHEKMVGGTMMSADRTIVENASMADNLTTLVAAVKAGDLVGTLSSEGPFTVFAPTNEAFAKLPDGTVEGLLKPENEAKLKSILTYHVVPSRATAEAVVGMIENASYGEASVQTVQGGTLTLMLEGENVIVEDEQGNLATVTIADVMQSNGVVHVVDTVLLPGA